MSRVVASVVVPGPVAEAEALWYEPSRWPTFVDGFATVVRRDPDWPRSGQLVWTSTPHGRGRVVERVTEHEPGGGQAAMVEDARLAGVQRVAFEAEGTGTRVTLSLEYSLKQRNLLTPVVDLLFVRRAVGDAVRRTVMRFAHERRSEIELT